MKYLYYTLWQLFKKIKTNDTPATNAMIFISLCQMLNLFAVYVFFILIANKEIIALPKSTVLIYSASTGSIVLLINYFVLYKGREALDNKYKNETKKQKCTGRVFLGLYFLGSTFLAFYLGIMGSMK